MAGRWGEQTVNGSAREGWEKAIDLLKTKLTQSREG